MDLPTCIRKAVGTAIDQDLLFVVGYSYPPGDRSSIALLVAERRFFGEISALFAEEYSEHRLTLGRSLDPLQAKRFQTLHRGIREVLVKCPSFDSSKLAQKMVARDALASICVSHWYARGFLLFDICSFTTFTTAEQVARRLILDASVRRALAILNKTCTQKPDPPLFNIIPTGDGFYIWNSRAGRKHDALTVALGALTLAELKHSFATPIHVRTAFAVGPAFTLPTPSIHSDSQAEWQFQDAIGPAPNVAARLCAAAAPDQFLLGEFDDLAPDEDVKNVSQLLAAAAATIPNLTLRLNPGTKFRIIDKHGGRHYCYNVLGSVAVKKGRKERVRGIGLQPDTAPELRPGDFRAGGAG